MDTTQQAFHPMRGHMTDGCRIACDNGDELVLKNTMYGWELVDQNGKRIGERTNDAFLITRYVIGYGQ